MEQSFICIFILLAVLSQDASGSSTLCPPYHRRLGSFPPCPLVQLAATSSPRPPTPNATSPTSDPAPASASAPVILMDTSPPPLESPVPQPSPSGGRGWNKAKTGGVAAGGSIAVVGALLLVSKVASFSFLDLNIVRQIRGAGKRFVQAVLKPSAALRELLEKTSKEMSDGKSLLASAYPVFEGGDAKKFLQQYETFARSHKMHRDLLSHVEVYLDPAAREWYRSKRASGEIGDWKAFVDMFQKEFGREETYEQVLEELENFQQGANEPVDDYTRRALEFVSRLDQVNPCQQQPGQVSNNEKYVQLRFLAGLKPNLREKVKAGVKGMKSVSWDVLQAVAKAVSFEAADMIEMTEAGLAVEAKEQALGELKALNLDAAKSVTKQCLEELQVVALDDGKKALNALNSSAAEDVQDLKTAGVSLDAPKIEEVSLDIAGKLETDQGAAEVQPVPVTQMPPSTQTSVAAEEIERLSSSLHLLKSQLLEVQQQQRRPQHDESRRSRGTTNVVCYSCRERGHYRSQCPKRQRNASKE